MAHYAFDATYCTRGGNPGSFSTRIEAATMEEATRLGQIALARGRPEISKVDTRTVLLGDRR